MNIGAILLAILENVLPKAVSAWLERRRQKRTERNIAVRYRGGFWPERNTVPLSSVPDYDPLSFEEKYVLPRPDIPNLKESWDDFALRQSVKYGGPDFMVLHDKHQIGTINVVPLDTTDLWRISVFRLDGTEISEARRKMKGSPSDIFTSGIYKAVRRMLEADPHAKEIR